MCSNTDNSIRILHVVGAMNRGGIESWLMQIVRTIDRKRFKLDFLVHTDVSAAFDEELRQLDCRIIRCPWNHDPFSYGWRLRKVIKRYGPYDIVHSHHGVFSAYILFVSKISGIRRRIAHSHGDFRSNIVGAGRVRHAYVSLMKPMLRLASNKRLAASITSAKTLFGESYSSDSHAEVLHYGIDLEPFAASVDENRLRDELGLSADAFVVGHVGRFDPQKNHEFLLDIVQEAIKQEPRLKLLLVGEGRGRHEIEQKAKSLGIEEIMIFAGVRSDVPALMLSVMDVFLFPSRWEGLGIVLAEAQAAGLPCFFSDVIPEEANIVPELAFRLSLESPPSAWVEQILQHRKPRVSQAQALRRVSDSAFNIQTSVARLQQCYAELVIQSREP